MFSLALFALAVPLVVSAQQVHQVDVGSTNGTLAFSPEAISANPGDVVTFTFKQKNHTVVQSSFADPCGPLDGGLRAPGFFPVAADQTDDFPQWNITVQTTAPIWVYCAQQIPASHCHAGMVFAVNCGADGAPNSFTNFKAAAIAAGASDTSSSAYAAPTTSSSTDAPPSTISIPPAPLISTVTAAVTVASSTWTTTYGSYPNSPAPTPASLTGNVINVAVGDNGTLTFNPPFTKALPRDTIVFTFKSKNHTVTQSTFADPCKKLDNATTGQVGIDSGFMPVTAGATDFPTYNLTVNDTMPIWIYCRQTNPVSHCGSGMVMAINSDESSPRSSTAFAALAKQINGTSNAATTASGAAPAATTTQSSGTIRSTGLSAVALVTLVGGLMAML